MTDRLQKALNHLSQKESVSLKEILTRLKDENLQGLDLKKLKGHDDIFRVRKGRLRVIFRRQDNKILLLAIERRSEKTYKHF